MALPAEVQTALDNYSAAIIEAADAAVTRETAQVVAAIEAAANRDGFVSVTDVVDSLNASAESTKAAVAASIDRVYIEDDGTATDPGDDGDTPAEPPVEEPIIEP